MVVVVGFLLKEREREREREICGEWNGSKKWNWGDKGEKEGNINGRWWREEGAIDSGPFFF